MLSYFLNLKVWILQSTVKSSKTQKLAATIKYETNLNFQCVTRNLRVFKGFGLYLSNYDQIFELFDKINFRSIAGEKKQDNEHKLAFALKSLREVVKAISSGRNKLI